MKNAILTFVIVLVSIYLMVSFIEFEFINLTELFETKKKRILSLGVFSIAFLLGFWVYMEQKIYE